MKKNKIEEKKERIFAERVQRLVAKGKTEEEAALQIRREDYENLPISQKIVRLERMLLSFAREMGEDLQHLRENDWILSRATDINTRVINRCFKLAGVDQERQNAILKEVEEEFRLEEEKAKEEAVKQEMEAAEKAVPTAENEPAEALPTPEGATVFGG